MLATNSARAAAGFGLCLTVVGCMALPGPLTPSRDRDRASGTPPARLADRNVGEPGPELRICDNEIPLVPVPPVPLGNGPRRSLPTPTNEVVPASLSTPTSPSSSSPPAREESPFPAAGDPDGVRKVYRLAADGFGPIDSYIARLTRREVVNGQKKPEEVMLFKFRKEPWSVYFKWVGEVGRGREVLYVKDKHDNKLHTLLAAGDVPFMPAGKRFSVSPDSLAVRAASRHPITEAGLGASLARLGSLLEAQERGDRRRGTLTYLGPQLRPEFPRPLALLEQLIPAGAEKELSNGGKRLYGFDPESRLPVLVITTDHRGQEVEYYRYDRLQFPVRLDDDDFNPEKLWATPEKTARP